MVLWGVVQRCAGSSARGHGVWCYEESGLGFGWLLYTVTHFLG